MLRFIVVDLVDRNRGVYDGGLDRLLLDDRLDVLMNVVVHMLTSDCRGGGRFVLSLADSPSVLVLRCFGGETFLDVRVVAVFDMAVFNIGHLVAVLLGEDLLVLDRLDGSVVMILVDYE